MRKGITLIFILIAALRFSAQADHLMGGEISWKCLPSTDPNAGKFVFTMILYRDCNGAPMSCCGPFNLNSNSPAGTITMHEYDTTDVSPTCNPDPNLPHIVCGSQSGSYDTGAVEQYIYKSDSIIINGIPPVGGWTFYWESCCRNLSIENVLCSSYRLRAKMYPYNGQNTYPCYDTSPKFYEQPKAVICTEYEYTFNHNAADENFDSLRYDWAYPQESGGSNCTFAGGYAYDNPFPDSTENPLNVRAVIDPTNGEITMTCYTGGYYIVCNKVSEYRCGQLIGEVFRDIQVVLKTCRPLVPNTVPPTYNNAPLVTPPFTDSLGNFSYVTTVYAGQQVAFFISLTDFDLDPGGNLQELHLEPSGLEFSGDMVDPTDCIWPQCAMLIPPPQTTVGLGILQFQFDWQTSCAHMRQDTVCRILNNVHHFVFKAYDDFCPIPGVNLFTVSVVLLPPTLPNPVWKCASVDSAGIVRVEWRPEVPDTLNMFHAWFIYRSTSATGTYTLIDTVTDPTQLYYDDGSIDGRTGVYYYKISTFAGCDTIYTQSKFPLSDYIRTMKLDVTNSGTGYANLSWNSTHDPLIPTNEPTCKLYKRVSNGTWDPVPGTVTVSAAGMTFSDPVTVCADSVEYKVVVLDSSGCPSVSSIDKDYFTDVLPPSVPLMDSVSMDALGNAIVTWQVDSTPDTHAYIILHFTGGNWNILDTVYGINSTFYATGINAENSSELFRVYAADSCWNPSAWSLDHNTELLGAELDACQSLTRVHWNRYINWPGAVNYAVYRTENGGSPTLLTVTGDTLIEDVSIVQGSTYCYHVVAIDATTSSRTSTSNEICVLAEIPRAPLFNYVTTATVAAPGHVQIRAYADILADVREYKLMRSEQYSDGYVHLGTVPFTGATLLYFDDFTASTDEKSYYYRVIVVDTCGVEIDTSSVGRTILVRASHGDDYTNTVSWNDYEMWLGGVSHYSLYRSVDGIPEPAPLVPSIAPGSTDYIDNIADFALTSDGKFCYYVMAYEGVGNTYGFRDTSTSNVACIIASPVVFIPNAFSPSAARSPVNSVFNPFHLFVDASSYSMRIFNRFGEEIFVTTDTQVGWDGTYKGQPVQPGVYAYFIKMIASDGTEIERRGAVTLVR